MDNDDGQQTNAFVGPAGPSNNIIELDGPHVLLMDFLKLTGWSRWSFRHIKHLNQKNSLGITAFGSTNNANDANDNNDKNTCLSRAGWGHPIN